MATAPIAAAGAVVAVAVIVVAPAVAVQAAAAVATTRTKMSLLLARKSVSHWLITAASLRTAVVVAKAQCWPGLT
jgi:hypothetical protein